MTAIIIVLVVFVILEQDEEKEEVVCSRMQSVIDNFVHPLWEVGLVDGRVGQRG
jgi:hypothetical protein